MKGKRLTGPVGVPPSRSQGSSAPQRKQRTNAWAKVENSEEIPLQPTSKDSSTPTQSNDAQVLGATSKHKGQCVWKPTLRPLAKRPSDTVELHATPILLDHTVATAPFRTDTSPMRLGRTVSRIGDGDNCGPLDETVDVERSKSASALQDLSDSIPKRKRSDALPLGVNSYIDALLSWLNYDDPQQHESPISQDTRRRIVTVMEESVNVIICSETELSGVRKSWGDDVLRMHGIAAWSVEEPRMSWKSNDWRMDLQALDTPAVEYLMFCSIQVHRKERWEQHNSEGYDNRHHEESKGESLENEFVVACRLRPAKQVHGTRIDKLDPREMQGQYFAIACPPNIVPLEAVMVSHTSDKKWCSDHRLVSLLPE
jgi:hypothetical protein